MDKRVALRYLTAECPTRPFGAPRSATSGALDRTRLRSFKIFNFSGGTKGTKKEYISRAYQQSSLHKIKTCQF